MTRRGWVENDPRRSLPSQIPPQDESQKYKHNPMTSTCSPLSNLDATRPRFQDNSPDSPTVSLNDMDYSHIGAFKLGSLRITNGAPSPVPSVAGRSTTTGGEYDYFEGSDGRGSANSHRGIEQRSHTTTRSLEATRAPWVTPAESPLRQSHAKPEKPLRVNTHLPPPAFSAFTFSTRTHQPSHWIWHMSICAICL